MDDFWASIGKWFKEKTTSPLYGTYVFSVILWNWKFFYILFWQSENNLLLPRIEYAQEFLDRYDYWGHLFHFLILPTLSTFVIIWLLPVASNWAHGRTVYFYFQRKRIFDDAKIVYEENKNRDLENLSNIKLEQAKTRAAILENTTQEERWADEFDELRAKPIFAKFKQLTDVLYGNGGATHRFNKAQGFVRIIEPEILGLMHSRGVVTKKGANSDEFIELTEKGKFFVSKFLENMPYPPIL